MSGFDDLMKRHGLSGGGADSGDGGTQQASGSGAGGSSGFSDLMARHGLSGLKKTKGFDDLMSRNGVRVKKQTPVTVRLDTPEQEDTSWVREKGSAALSMLPDNGAWQSEQTRTRFNDPLAHYNDTAEKSDAAGGAAGRAANNSSFVGPLPSGARGTAGNAASRATAHAEQASAADERQTEIVTAAQKEQKNADRHTQRALQLLKQSGAVQNADGSFTFPDAETAREFQDEVKAAEQAGEQYRAYLLEYEQKENTRRGAAAAFQQDKQRYDAITADYDANALFIAQSAGANGYKMPGYNAAEDKEDAQTDNAFAKLAREASRIYEKLDAKTSSEGVESLGEDGRRLYNAGKIIAEAGTPRYELSDAQREALDLYEKYRPDRADVPLTTEEQATLERYEYAVSSWTEKQIAEAKAQPDFAAKSKQRSAPGTIDPTVFWNDLNEAERVSAMVDGDEIGSWLRSDAPLDYVGYMFSSENATEEEWYAYRMMSDDEKATFRYLWNTDGREAALGFAKLLKPKLNHLYANAAMDTGGTWGKLEDQTIGSVAYGTNKAMRGLSYGVGKLFGDDQPMPDEGGTVAQYRGMLHEDPVTIGGTGVEKYLAGAGMSAAESAGQMLPAMAASVAGQGISAALAGSGAVSVGGSLAHQAAVASAIGSVPQAAFSSTFYTEIFSQNYIEGRRQGMDETQASIYGGLTAASEVATQTLLGYVPGLQGVMSENFGDMLASKVQSAAAKTVMQWAGRVSGEVIEENFQNVLEPLIKAVATQQTPEFWGSFWEFFDEFLETTVSTLMLTTAMGAADTVSDYMGYKAEAVLEQQAAWADMAMTAPEGSEIYLAGETLAEELRETGTAISADRFRQLVDAVGSEYDAAVASANAAPATAEQGTLVLPKQQEQQPAQTQATAVNAEERYAGLPGMTPEQAKQAADTLDALKSGETTVAELSNQDILNLRLDTPDGRAIVSEVLGTEIGEPSGMAGMRRALKNAVETAKSEQPGIDNAAEVQYSENGNSSVTDERLQEAMERLNRGEAVTEQEVTASPTIKDAKQRSDAAAQNPTININTPERQVLRDDCAIALLEMGSAQYDANGKIVKGENGETAYGGEVERGHRIDIVVGLPAAGKSSVLVDPLSAQHHARVIDNDMAKAMLPEFDNGIGAGAVHEESKVISESALNFALDEGDNIVLPIVGGDYSKLLAQIEKFRAAGYTVAVHLCDLPSNKAIGRAIGRYLNTGRYIPMDILYGYGNKPKENFYRLVQEGIIHEYSEYSNDVGYGEPPRPIRQSAADTGGTGNQRQRERTVAEDVRRSGQPSDGGGDGARTQVLDDNSGGRVSEDAGVQAEVHRPAEGESGSGEVSENAEPPESGEKPQAKTGGNEPSTAETEDDRARRQTVYNTLRHSEVFGGVLHDVYQELTQTDPEATHYDVVHELESMAAAAERVRVDPNAEAEYLLSDNSGHTWSGEDVDTAMGLISKYQLDGDTAKATELAKAVAEAETKAGQAVQALAKWSRTPEGAAVEALKRLNDGTLSEERVNEIGGKLFEYAGRLNAAAKELSSDDGTVLGRGGNEFVSVISDLAGLRGTVNPFSSKMGPILRRVLNRLPNETLRAIATAQMYSVPSDLTRETSIAEKAGAIMRLNDLSNLGTPSRNFSGNGLFSAVDSAAANLAVPFDVLLSQATGRRTVAPDRWVLSKEARRTALASYFQAYAETALDVNTDDTTSKYGSSSSRVFKMSGNAIERFMSRAEEIQAHLLVDSDELFKGAVRGEVLRGLSKLVEDGKLTAEQSEKLADMMAKERTFQQDSAPAKFAGKMKQALNVVGFGGGGTETVTLASGEKIKIDRSMLSDADYRNQLIQSRETAEEQAQMRNLIRNISESSGERFGLGNVMVNYTSVAGNLVDLAIKYEAGSVLGFANMIRTLSFGKNAPLEMQRNAVLTMGRGITGAALTYAFAKLAKLGILLVAGAGGDDDDKKRSTQRGVEHLDDIQVNWDALIRLIKGEDTTLRDGDTLLDLGFAQPLDAMMTTGAMMANGDSAAEGFANGLFSSLASTPGLEEFGSLYTTLTGYGSEIDAGNFADVAKQLALDSVSRTQPAFMRAVAKASDPYYRDLYTSDSFWGQLADRYQYGVPGWRNSLPIKTDAYGNEKTYGGSTAMRVANAIVLPGKVEQYSTTRAAEEAERLYQATGESVYPSTSVQATQTWTDSDGDKQEYTLTAQEKSAFRTRRGQAYERMQLDLMDNSDEWGNLSDDEKVEVMKDVWKIATEYAKAATIPGYRSSSKEYNLMRRGDFDYSDILTIKTARKQCEDMTDSASAAQTHFRAWVDAQSWNKRKQDVVLDTYGTFFSMAPANTEKYDTLAPMIGADAALEITEQISALKPAEGHSSVTDWQKIATIATASMPEKQKWTVIAQYTDDWRAGAFRDAGLPPAAYAGYKKARSESQKAAYEWVSASGFSDEAKDKIRRIIAAKNKDAYYGS